MSHTCTAVTHDSSFVCSIQEQRSSVAVLLAGTSGTGKSTLAGLLAARLGITTVLSTDNIRHLLRSFATEESNPLLWASTYQVSVCPHIMYPAYFHPACFVLPKAFLDMKHDWGLNITSATVLSSTAMQI